MLSKDEIERFPKTGRAKRVLSLRKWMGVEDEGYGHT